MKKPMGLLVATLAQFMYDEIVENVPPEKQCTALARTAALTIQALKNLAGQRGIDWRPMMSEQLGLIDEAVALISSQIPKTDSEEAQKSKKKMD